MKPDDTIVEAWPLLKSPDAYVTGVLDHLQECMKTHGSANVRIGTVSTGKYPSYRICWDELGQQVFGSFTDSHKPFQEGYDKVVPGKWSSRSMTIDALASFYAAKTKSG